MSELEKIFADASQPATLRHAGGSVHCHTLQEAVLAWMRLSEKDREQATIWADDGAVYTAKEIDRLHIAPTPYAEMVKDGTYQVKVPLAGHALPHVFPNEFPSQETAERWIASPEGRDLTKKVRDKYSPRQS
jgi:hypothetical protein